MIDTDGIAPHTRDLLRIALEPAVLLWIARLQDQPVAHILERAKLCGQHIAEKGDVLQFKSKTKGASAEAFSRLAEGLAAMAIVAPGGVTFLDLHFELKRS